MGELLERAKKVAEHKGMSMAQFQEKIGVSISHFYNTDKLSLKTKRAVSEVFPDINADWLETGEGFMTNTDKLQEEGGTPNNFEYQIKKHDCEMMISPIENISMAITVTGDSMSPEYPSGSKVLVQKINEKAFIEWGNTYVLDTVNGAIIKNVFQAKGDDTKVICRSVNPNFADFTIDVSDIRGWYRVRCCITIK